MLDFHDRFCFGVGVGSSYLALRGLNSSDFPRAPKGLNRDVHYAIWWGPNLFVFQSHADVKVYDLNYQEVQLTGSLRTYNGSPAWGVVSTSNLLYYSSGYRQVSAIDKDLLVKTVIELPKESITDFHVDPRTEEVLILTDGELRTNEELICNLKLFGNPKSRGFTRLKQMYSDHFLAAARTSYENEAGGCNEILLVDRAKRAVLSSVKINSTSSDGIYRIRVMRPRHLNTMQFFLAPLSSEIHLCYEWNQTLSQLSSVYMESPTWGFSFVTTDTWITGGTSLKIQMLKMHFPEALKL